MAEDAKRVAEEVPFPRIMDEGPEKAVTGMITRTIRPGCEAAFEALLRGQLAAAGRFPGFRGAEVIHRPGDTHREYTAIFRFQTLAQLRAWEFSSERGEWLERMAGLIKAESPLSTMCGMETWFTLAGGGITKPPQRYKMAAVSWLAAFPLATVLNYGLNPVLEGQPTVLRALALTIVLIPTMTYIIMPQMTRLFRRWLYPGERPAK